MPQKYDVTSNQNRPYIADVVEYILSFLKFMLHVSAMVCTDI